MVRSRRVVWGFVAAGIINIVGALLFSKGFTNSYLSDLSPIVASRFGLILIVLWGLAYLTVARGYRHVPVVVLVFAVEKLVYVLTWLVWLYQHGARLPEIWAHDPLTAIFFAIYGPNDLFFCLFFAWVGVKAWVDKA